MIETEIGNLKKKKVDENNPYFIFLDYDEVIQKTEYILSELGSSGLIMFSENSALLSFDSNKAIRLRVKKKNNFSRNDFKRFGENFEIIGKGAREVGKPFNLFFNDIKHNIFKIIIIILLFSIIANPISKNIEIIKTLNEKLIEVIGIFIGMVFVFIGFFYGDKERTIDVYKKGLCDKEFKTDCYIINLAIIDLVIVCVSLLCGNLSSADIPVFIINNCIGSFLNNHLRFWVCYVLTSISLVIIIIEFDALTNYYLRTMRYKYFIDAFESKIHERRGKK